MLCSPDTRKGAGMEGKRTYEKPEMQRLGLLRRLTKFSGWQPPRWG